MNLDVTHEAELAHPIEAVWSELTNAAAISDWLMKTTDFEPVVGCRFRMKTQNLSSTGYVEAEVVELDPPRRMVWSWSVSDGNAPSTVSFELSPQSRGTLLRLRHTGTIDPEVARMLREGWPGRIAALAQAIRQ